jgi:hypothetical protein
MSIRALGQNVLLVKKFFFSTRAQNSIKHLQSTALHEDIAISIVTRMDESSPPLPSPQSSWRACKAIISSLERTGRLRLFLLRTIWRRGGQGQPRFGRESVIARAQPLKFADRRSVHCTPSNSALSQSPQTCTGRQMRRFRTTFRKKSKSALSRGFCGRRNKQLHRSHACN